MGVDSPHAILRMEGSHGLFGAQTIAAVFVNRGAANSHPNQQVNTVPAGKVALVLNWDSSYPFPATRAETQITFDPEARQQYFVSDQDAAEFFTFDVRDERGTRIVTRKIQKQEGASWPQEAGFLPIEKKRGN